MSAFVINPYSFVSSNITEFSFVEYKEDAGNATTYTISGVNFGAADANRRILIAFISNSINVTHTASSATIGGVSATVVAQQTANLGGGRRLHAFLMADVPTGSSGTVAVTLSNEAVRASFGVYRLVASALPTLVDDDLGSASAATSATATINIEPGIVVATANGYSSGSGQTLSFSGIATTDYTALVESNTLNGSASEVVTATTTQAITATRSASNGMSILAICLK